MALLNSRPILCWVDRKQHISLHSRFWRFRGRGILLTPLFSTHIINLNQAVFLAKQFREIYSSDSLLLSFVSVPFSSVLCGVRGIVYCVTENPIAGDLWPTLQYANFTPQNTVCLKSTCIVMTRRLPTHKVTTEQRNSTDYSSQYSIHSGDKNSWIKWTRCHVVIADSSKGIVIRIFSLKKY
jgi:hypothetical protein